VVGVHGCVHFAPLAVVQDDVICETSVLDLFNRQNLVTVEVKCHKCILRRPPLRLKLLNHRFQWVSLCFDFIVVGDVIRGNAPFLRGFVPVLKLAIDSDQVILLHNVLQLEDRILFLPLELKSFTLDHLVLKEKLLQLLGRILNFF
jgi:hypothetical protein